MNQFVCLCPNRFKYTKSIVNDVKDFKKIVKNYIKINRLYKIENPD